MALNEKVFVDNPASIGGGQYTFDLYISNASQEKYLVVGDIVEDTSNNRYQIDTWVGSPSDFSDGAQITATFVDNDVLPTQDTGSDSDWFTEGLEDIRPQMQTEGTLSGISIFSGQNFEYTVTAGWDVSVEAAKAVVGDYVADASGIVYELTFIDGSNRFTVPCRMKEVEKYGNSPNAGLATMYRPTSEGSFTGRGFSNVQADAVRNRDSFVSDNKVLLPRVAVDNITTSIADAVTENMTIVGYRGYILYKIETSHAAWVRIYTSTSDRASDSSRDEGTDPLPGSGVIAEIISTGAEIIFISPGAIGFSEDETTNIYLAVTNKNGSPATVQVTLTVIKIEA